jgi:hypothetical protein
MKLRILFCGLLIWASAIELRAQEASSGFALAATVSAEALQSEQLSNPPRNGSSVTGAVRAVLYPTWKLNRHWTISAAVEGYTRPYFFEDFTKPGSNAQAQLLQATVSYSRFWENRSVIIRVGQLSSAFGSFLLRYDDAVNLLVDMPMSYGYYQKGVSTASLAGAEMDSSLGKLDLRLQFTNSSPANPRSILDHDQYGNWAGGAGYTIRQGLRVGVSAYRGPYLDRQFPFYRPGEAPPSQLPATGLGADLEWGRGRWNVNAEWQQFQMDYRVRPDFIEQTGYGEARFVLHPRWYLATRLGYIHPNLFPGWRSYEAAVGFRPGARELIKLEYEVKQGPTILSTQQNTLAVQFVATLPPLSIRGR